MRSLRAGPGEPVCPFRTGGPERAYVVSGRRAARTPLTSTQVAGSGNPVTTPGRVTAASQALRANTAHTSTAKLSSGSVG